MKNLTFNYEFSFFGYSFNFSMDFIGDNYECTIYSPIGNKAQEIYIIIAESEDFLRFQETIIDEICNIWIRSKEYSDLLKSPKFLIAKSLMLTPRQIAQHNLLIEKEVYSEFINDFTEDSNSAWFFECECVVFSKNHAKKLRKLSIKNSTKFPFHKQSADHFLYKAEQAAIAGASTY